MSHSYVSYNKEVEKKEKGSDEANRIRRGESLAEGENGAWRWADAFGCWSVELVLCPTERVTRLLLATPGTQEKK